MMRSLAALGSGTVLALGALACGGGGGGSGAGGGGAEQGAGELSNPLLFVTQVPIAADFANVVATFGSHLGHASLAPRGGDLHLLYPDGTLRNLTQEAGYGVEGLQVGPDAIAVREPEVHWSGTKAVFSMVVGGPGPGQETVWFWQLYEVTGLAQGQTASITKVPNQPTNANNVSPCYASDGRILFVSDRPRGGNPHLYPQLDEYEGAPTNTGIWSLNPATGQLFIMNHSPSGSFTPIVDSFGRVVFTRWDHLERDQQADEDNMGFGNFGSFNWSDESPGSVDTGSNAEVFPEPNRRWIDFVNTNPGYAGPPHGFEPFLVGNRQNHFFPWTLNQDGTEEETLNHLGRQELHGFAVRARNDDPNLLDHFSFAPEVANRNGIENMFQISEDPLVPGTFYGIDAVEFGTHAAGQIVKVAAPTSANANQVTVTYSTHPDTKGPSSNPAPTHSGLYRNPIRLTNGRGIAVHTPETREDQEIGTPAQPRSRYDFRLKLLKRVSGHFVPDLPLTAGVTKDLQYWDPYVLRGHTGPLWELDPVEVVARPVPPSTTFTVPAAELQVLADEGIALASLKGWLNQNNLALLVSRDVTTRDDNDHQQPYNLRVPGGTVTMGEPGTVYDVAHMQLYQGDRLRGFHNGIFLGAGGRRVIGKPLHDAPQNPPNPGGPPGSVQIAPDGSMAALVPARRAMAWQLVDPSGEAIVRERYWISFQPGEVRTCFSCHGVNDDDQAGQPPPTNPPQALNLLLQHLKNQGEL